MVLNSGVVVEVAKVSANACQYVACNPERLPSDQVLYLLFCFPFQHIRRLAFCLCTVFCFPPNSIPLDGDDDDDDDDDPYHYRHPRPSFYYSSSSSSSSADSDLQDLHPHLL